VIREKPSGSASWTTTANLGGAVVFPGNLAADGSGNLFFSARAASSTNHWTTWELLSGSTTPVQIDDAGVVGYPRAEATDAAGNLYVAGELVVPTKGNTSTDQWAVRKGVFNGSPGKWSFSTVDQTATASVALGIGVVTTTVNGVPSSGVYAVGRSGSSWVVRASKNGGPWSQVDSFKYDSTGGNAIPSGVAGDLAGNIFVVGEAQKGDITGYTKNRTPIYSYPNHWIVRKSANGGASWITNDDYQYPQSSQGASGYSICRDPSGSLYVAGEAYDGTGFDHAVVRTNAGGTWNTVDHYSGLTQSSDAWYNAIAADSAGNVYAGGVDDTAYTWMIRSQPAAPAKLTALADATHSTSQINLSWVNAAGSDESGFAVYRSTSADMSGPVLVASVGAGATAYADSGLSAGTVYYYDVAATLNSVDGSPPGSSVMSNTAGAATAPAPAVTPTAAAAVFSSTRITTATDPADIFHHGKHWRG
jgi:hypothetical protein